MKLLSVVKSSIYCLEAFFQELVLEKKRFLSNHKWWSENWNGESKVETNVIWDAEEVTCYAY